MRKLSWLVFGLWLIIGHLLHAEEKSTEDQADARAIHYSDCHIHLLNFLQGGEFLNDDKKFPGSRWGEVDHQRFVTLPAGQRWRRIAGLLYAMDRGNIDFAMVCGMGPPTKPTNVPMAIWTMNRMCCWPATPT
jgi:hypothetical protein